MNVLWWRGGRGEAPPLAETAKEAFALYIRQLERDYYPWYDRVSRRLQVFWSVGQGTAILAGVLTAVIAATANEDTFKSFGILKTLLVVLPLIGTLAASLLTQTRARDLLALRERGREAMQALITAARADFAASVNDEARLSTLHATLATRVSVLEREQAGGFFQIAPGGRADSGNDARPE